MNAEIGFLRASSNVYDNLKMREKSRNVEKTPYSKVSLRTESRWSFRWPLAFGRFWNLTKNSRIGNHQVGNLTRISSPSRRF